MTVMEAISGTLAHEAQVDRRIDELLAKIVVPGWSDAERAEYQMLVGSRTTSMRDRGDIGRHKRVAA